MPPTPKSVLISLADNANDHGECFPSVTTICARTCLSERAVQEAVAWLERHGALRRNMRTGRSTTYAVCPAAYDPPQQAHPRATRTPAAGAPSPRSRRTPPPHVAHPTPAAGAPITVKEPSKEPSRNKKSAPEALQCPDEVPEQVWADWQRVRAAKRGGAVTATALAGIEREAERAGLTLAQALVVCCERSWVGFRADWYAAATPQARASPYRSAADARDERDGAFMHALTGGLAGRIPTQPRTIDAERNDVPRLVSPRD